jgi:hypothetical protein
MPERIDVRKTTMSYRAHSYHTKVPPAPGPERFLSEDAERAAGSEMALNVEGVEDYGVNRWASLA